MNEKKLMLFVADKMGIATALLRTACIAAGSNEVFIEDGQAIATTLEVVGTELRRCRNVVESFLQKEPPVAS